MRVRMLKTAAGPEGTYPEGWVGELPIAKARAFVAADAAVLLEPDEIEEAVMPGVETADLPRKRGRPKRGA